MFVRLVRSLSSASLSLSSAAAFTPSRTVVSRFPQGFCRQESVFHPITPCFDTRTYTATRSYLTPHPSFQTMPQPPYQYQSADAPTLDLLDLSADLVASDEKRQDAYDKSRKFQKAMIKAQRDLDQNKAGVSESIKEMQTFLAEAIGTNDEDKTGRVPRIANLGQRMEDLCRFMAFHHFLETGKLLPPTACFGDPMKATDEEYLAGACMGLCQDLSRYALGRATARDVESVQQARDLVNEILDYLLKFDFRNGNLRRRYDGTKYALKSLETLLYELSVTGASLETDEGAPEAKRPRIEEETPGEGDQPPTLAKELEALRLRYEHRDGLREKLIKKSRDGQKAAKQAIYALHRKDYKKAARLIRECEDCINTELLPIVNEEPPLRSSSFAGVIEEYAEAKLFYAWLLGNNSSVDTETSDKNAPANGTLLLPNEFSIGLESGDYLGGICDLTGEIGRFAVQRGTARDYDGVRQCLEANSAILTSIESLEKPPGGINKKMSQLRQSVSKIERMIYEMSLSKAAGMKMNSEVKDAPAEEE